MSGNDLHQVVGKLRRRSRGWSLGEMTPRFRLHAAVDVGRAEALVLVAAPDQAPRTSGPRSAKVPVQRDRLFVDLRHRLLLRERPFIERPNVFHSPDLLLTQFRHAPHFFPHQLQSRQNS